MNEKHINGPTMAQTSAIAGVLLLLDSKREQYSLVDHLKDLQQNWTSGAVALSEWLYERNKLGHYSKNAWIRKLGLVGIHQELIQACCQIRDWFHEGLDPSQYNGAKFPDHASRYIEQELEDGVRAVGHLSMEFPEKMEGPLRCLTCLIEISRMSEDEKHSLLIKNFEVKKIVDAAFEKLDAPANATPGMAESGKKKPGRGENPERWTSGHKKELLIWLLENQTGTKLEEIAKRFIYAKKTKLAISTVVDYLGNLSSYGWIINGTEGWKVDGRSIGKIRKICGLSPDN
jgi:hypothetical protein